MHKIKKLVIEIFFIFKLVINLKLLKKNYILSEK